MGRNGVVEKCWGSGGISMVVYPDEKGRCALANIKGRAEITREAVNNIFRGAVYMRSVFFGR